MIRPRDAAPGPSADGGDSPDRPDLGLFGPGSVTWRVQTEPMVAAGGVRALFLQAVHPRAMAAVAQNSGFRTDPWGRLTRTAEYVATVAFGTTEEAQRAAARVRGVHRRMRGVDPDTGEEFRIDEPDLLRWVHVCETESFVTTVRRAGVPLDDADVDRYYAEQRESAALVGLDPATVPSSAAEVAEYYAAMRPHLRVGPDARAAAVFLFWPPMPYPLGLTPARPGWAGLAGLGFALLPGWARRMYGTLGLPLADMPATVALRSLRRVADALPESVKRGPKTRAAHQRVTGSAAG